ncbi:hypothetical protein AX17_005277 [Amanita inopinata Kibby_2008]|nr:hypothetical protein AX17_005277 [Amanita inopinata Kibby_2008]
MTDSVILDPLTINLQRQARLLLEKLPQGSPYAAELSHVASNRRLLVILSCLLAKPELTALLARAFRPLLVDLCARWIEGDDCDEEQFVAISYLVEPQEELYPVLDRMLQKTRFKNGPLGLITEDTSDIETSRLHALLIAYYRILQVNREIPDIFLWPLTPLSTIIWSERTDNASKLLAIRCYAMQVGMGEAEREKMEREVLQGEPFGPDCPLEYGKTFDGGKHLVDGWVLPVLELERVRTWRSEIPSAVSREGYYMWEEGETAERIDENDLSPLVVNVHGVLLLRSVPLSTRKPSALIPTPSTTIALRTLATHISLRLPTLLTSAASAGKSLLLIHLASLLHANTTNQLITIHLADTSLDPRALLGSYVSSPTSPGTFEWKEGVLVRAMCEGRWVVFEDVDKASSEVLGTIRPLIESMRLGRWIGQRAELGVPGRGKVIAADGFRVFATRSVKMPQQTQEGEKGKVPPPVFLGAHKFWEVVIESPTLEELKTILDAKYAKLRGEPARSLISLWEEVRALGPAPGAGAGGGREVGVRELEKFCLRVESLLPDSFQFSTTVDENPTDTPILPLSAIFSNPTLREDIFSEARDVFFGAGVLTASARTHSGTIARVVGNLLGLDSERQEWLLTGRTPLFTEEKDVNGRVVAVCAGFTRLEAKSLEHAVLNGPKRPFVMHRPAVMLLSRVVRAVALSEPVLLTGETGTGKTSAVTHLAALLHRKLVSLNLSHQTESGDLLGGFKPVDARVPASTLMERWGKLFGGSFSRKKNEKFESEVRKAVKDTRWGRVVGLWRESGRLARDRIKSRKEKDEVNRQGGEEAPRKRRKVEQGSAGLAVPDEAWAEFLGNVDEFEVQYVHAKGKFAFGFVEGPLVKALRSGDWILLDEINLASPETLECITGLLHGPTASITLSEQGSLEPIPRHPNFRLFACMNPATDVGKKDLPPNIRARFTEIDVPPPDADKETLLSIINQYIGSNAVGDKASIMNIAEFHQSVKALAEQRQIADGANHRPHYSMRTLARALAFASEIAIVYGFPLRRAIWEGCLMAFTMVLDRKSAEVVTALAHKHILAGVKNPKSLLTKEPNVPRGRTASEFIKFGPFYLERGPFPEDPVEEYIMTPSVESKLIDLARIVLTRQFPVLIEGPTSSGKTSTVEYLARRTGHRFVRINNHEHTDIQEYIGSYVSDPLTGKLVFKDGLLVRALRHGDWIVLDELNLAPTDVLEALNRLLDDNRELVIPETQEVVKPHPHFMLFATQNPPGLYAGRKVLSRAFRNRFLEVHFEDVPQAELEAILCQRCRIAPSYGKKIVAVFRELQKRRQTSRVFESKHGFATLRDLFRWAGRDAVGYQELAENGYMLIAERARREDDKSVVKEVIESVMGVRIDERTMYDFNNPNVADICAYLGCPVPTTDSAGVVWTGAMQQLFILVCRALRFNEPVLLVGETGSGKTSVCQVYADAVQQKLLGLNCHQNTETADLIGGLRPIRNRNAAEADVVREVGAVLSEVGVAGTEPVFDALALALNEALKLRDLDGASQQKVLEARRKLLRLQSIFEWHDGPLVEAMRNGNVFLLDEISLADDSVLERLNSVLEPSRTIVLAEKGGEDSDQAAVRAEESFKLIATMNPGGDYGKKELSPALRNRFTEIWVPPVEDRKDLELIVHNLWKSDSMKTYTNPLLDFAEWLCLMVGDRSLCNLRDILAWVTFMNSAYQSGRFETLPASEIFHHAAHMTFLDGLSSLPQLSSYSREAIQKLKSEAEAKLEELVPMAHGNIASSALEDDYSTSVYIGPFAILKGPKATVDHSFNLQAPTTQDNAMRIVRACQVVKPILLEGSPGVGKTSLVTALANVAGHDLCRINLSDQTDLIDLFGSDLPVEGGGPGEFAWRDAEFLKAMQEGSWVLLDEMNLAPQAVLEGLNAVLDHRGMVYIPELGRTFSRHPSFRIFAAQNPLSQGGGRKGLPKSFVNRFTKVYVEELSPNDLFMVCQQLFPELDEALRSFARQGNPWEFNLRDIIRWGYLLRSPGPTKHPVDPLRSIYLHRFRTLQDRHQARALFDQIFNVDSGHLQNRPQCTISSKHIQIGHYTDKRNNLTSTSRPPRILKKYLAVLESIGLCVSQSWLTILTGNQNSGKTEVVRLLAHFTGNLLWEISINNATDTMDILGSFEQVDYPGRILTLVKEVLVHLDTELRSPDQAKFKSLQEHQQSLRLAIATNLTSHTTGLVDLLRLSLQIVDKDIHKTPLRQRLISELNNLLSKLDVAGRFEWIDGPLIQAMKNGYWLLLDNANLCNPSVLDRLNSLCEPGGFLTLSERGFVGENVQTIKPHPNFRLFMTVDPQYGELSRAMRNRGIEIALIEPSIGDDSIVLLDHLRYLAPADPDDWRTGHLLFDQVRRGLCEDSHLLPQSFSTGRALDQDSALSYTTDQAPLVIKNSLRKSTMTDSHLFFFSRTAVRQYLPSYSRCLATEDFLNIDLRILKDFVDAFPVQVLGTAMASLRESYSVSRVVSSDFVLCQPMDFCLVNSVCIDDSSEEDATSVHHSVLQILDLVVAIFLHEKDSKGLVEIQDEVSSKKPSNFKVLDTVDTVLKSMQEAAQRLLRDVSIGHKEHRMSSPGTMNKVMNYGRHLRKAVNGSVVDFSSLLALSRCILDAVNTDPSDFVVLLQDARDLNDAVSLSSGHGLFDIWRSLYIDAYPPLVTRLNNLTSSPGKFSDATNLRRRVFEYMSLATLPSTFNAQESSLIELGSELERYLSEHGHNDITFECKHADATLLIIEYGLLSFLGAVYESKIPSRIVKEVIDLTVTDTGASLLRVVPYKQVEWCIEAGNVLLPLISRLHLQWLQEIWIPKIQCEGSVQDPSMLLQPTMLKTTFNLNDWSGQTLAALPQYDNQIERQARMTVLQCELDASRLRQSISFLYQSFLLITHCFDGHLSLDIHKGSQDYTESIKNFTSSLTKLIAMMEQASHQAFAQAVKRHLRPLLENTANVGRRSEYVFLGRCWVALSLLLFDLFIPDFPVDPAAIQNSTLHRLEDDAHDLSIQINLHRQLEEISTGNLDNIVLDSLVRNLEAISSQLSNKPKYPIRKDLHKLQTYWTEVLQFRNHVLDCRKIYDLVELLGKWEDKKLQERVLQQSIAGFYQRLDGVYEDFADVNLPLKLSMLYLRFGLRLVAESSTLETSTVDISSLDQLTGSLVNLPSLTDSLDFGREVNGSHSAIPAIQYVILHLASLSQENSLGIDLETNMARVNMSYEQALRLWLIDRAKEQERDEAANSLYRRSTMTHEVSEAEAEEQEFLALFPSFEDALSQDTTGGTDSKSRSYQYLQHEDAMQVVEIHLKLLGASGTLPIDTFNSIRKSFLERLLHLHSSLLPGNLDDESLALQLTMLSTRLRHLRESNERSETYNFYLDSNVPEGKKASACVEALKLRLDTLVQEWPDQMVLQHLRDKCDSFLLLGLSSPVAKLLSALEQLLVQTEDWEIYANKENTLKTYQRDLTHLIVEWRRLELSCWQGLLDSQVRTFSIEAFSWWFRLYESCVRGVLDACEQEQNGQLGSMSQYLSNLIPLLDDYISSSPLGQFHIRLQLLQSFERYLTYLKELSIPYRRAGLSRAQRVLHATVRYYELYSSSLSRSISDQKMGLEREIRELIKLASWKDINVQALKASSRKTHYQLFKIIRKFRDVLKQPVLEKLSPEAAGDAETKALDHHVNVSPSVDAAALYDDESDTSPKNRLSRLKHTFTRYDHLVASRIRPFIHAHSAHALDNFATEIIVMAKELSNLSVSPSVPAEKREKQQKALLVRKRKAWSDLLKELKRAGLSASPKPNVLRQLSDDCWLREQPILVGDDEEALSLERVETYYARLQAMMPRLRSLLSNHHSDVSTRELQRGIMILESGFSMAIDLRHRLAETIGKYNKLSKTCRRLRMMSSSPEIVASGQGVADTIQSMKDTLCRLSGALNEVQQGILTFYGLKPQASPPDVLLNEVQATLLETSAVRDQFVMLLRSIKLSEHTVLLGDEHKLMMAAQQHISCVHDGFRRWSQMQPCLNHLFRPVVKWIETQRATPSLHSPPKVADAQSTTDGLIDSMLVTVQTLLSNCPDQTPRDIEETDHYVLQQYNAVRDLTYMLNLDTINAQLHEAIVALACGRDSVEKPLSRVIPFIEVYVGVVRDQLARHCQWTKALFKLDYVLCSVIQALSKQGFCKPPDMGDADEGADSADASGGVGLGEGSGTQNVSKEIEDESQVEGLKGEEAEDHERDKTNDDGDAIEMSEDIGGDMQDVPGESEDEGSKSGDESEAEPEERLGKLDASDPSAVDEKLWGDEKGPEQSDQADDKTNKDHGEEQAGDSEVVAKEGKGTEKQDEKKGDKGSEMKDVEEQSDPQEEDEQMADDLGTEGEDNQKASGTSLDEHLKDAETLDLPDDMNIDDKEMEFLDEELPDIQEEAEDEVKDDGLQEPDVEENIEDYNGSEPAEDQEQKGEGQMGGETVEEGNGGEEEENLGKDEAVAQADISAGEGGAESTDSVKIDGQESPSTGQEGGAGGKQGGEPKDEAEEAKKERPVPEATNEQQMLQQSSAPSTVGAMGPGAQQGHMDRETETQTETNPLRSLGDALKEIRQRLDEILGGEQRDIAQEKIADANAPSQVEYLHPDDTDHEMQALGPAKDEQVMKLNDLKLIDDDTSQDGILPMDVDDLRHEQHEQPARQEESLPILESDVKTLKDDIEGAVTHDSRPIHNQLSLQPDLSMPKADIEMEDESTQQVELQLKEWLTSDFPPEGGEHMWRLYESLTHDLAYALCEQLRLILEPTLATRLKGDYRTGKRLNMKKIIPYIASDYTKDKIWLRRTRPSQREYQILIAIDDSRSMAESHSVHLAFQTLALVAKALSRLESGDVAIAKFGQSVHMLHNFDQGQFTDQAGTKVISSFRFDQKATNMLSLLEMSLKALESARERRSMGSATAADLWQLEIIISDGLCQDHERLRTVLRKAEEQRVMVVFIIVDSLHSGTAATSSASDSQSASQNSILYMDKAEYKLVDGRMELQLQKYLDTFPFEYYVVLRNVEALPDVLAGTLKQFFERISEN